MNASTALSEKQTQELAAPLQEFTRLHGLSKREFDVLSLLVHQVVSAESISEHLGISRNTVRIHLKNINTKVGTTSKSELLGKFIEYVIQKKNQSSEQEKIPGADLLILIADDDDSYVELVRKASENSIDASLRFEHVSDGQQLLSYLESVKTNSPDHPRPQIILLDLNMPKMNGFQALERLKTDFLFHARQALHSKFFHNP